MPPLYAQRADCLVYTENLEFTDNAEMDRIIERAEQDVDEACGDWPLLPGTLRKFDPPALTPTQREQLKRATCAQAEYRIVRGEGFFMNSQHERVKGPDFETVGALPRIAPKAVRELSGSGLVKIWRTVRPPAA